MRLNSGLIPRHARKRWLCRARVCHSAAPMTNAPTFLDAAAGLLGPRGLTQDRDLMNPWLTDWRGRFTGRALALASPTSTDEVAALVKLCAAHRVPIVPQGGNSGMCGGATPDQQGNAILLSLRRMNAIRRFDAAAQQVVCEAGVVLQTLHDAAEAHGLRFPLTLGGKGSATVGGLIATNAGGTQVLRHGSMRAQVLGIEAVLANGSVFNGLTALKKDNRGFDLKQLLIGSEGTLGVITAATLRLVPGIAARAVLWAGVASLDAARTLLLFCQDRAGDALEGFEVMTERTLRDVMAHVPQARAPLAGIHPWHALIELVADTAGADTLPERAERLLADAFSAGLLEDATIAASEAQAEAFWTLRDEIAPAERAKGPAVQHDISVAVERMPSFVAEAVARVEATWPGTEAVAFGHLGDGNVHFHVIAPTGTDAASWQDGDGKAISALVYQMVTEWDGSISAEHGIGQLKRDDLGRLGDPVAVGMLRAVKQALDPHGLLNPGKLVPLAPPRD